MLKCIHTTPRASGVTARFSNSIARFAAPGPNSKPQIRPSFASDALTRDSASTDSLSRSLIRPLVARGAMSFDDLMTDSWQSYFRGRAAGHRRDSLDWVQAADELLTVRRRGRFGLDWTLPATTAWCCSRSPS